MKLTDLHAQFVLVKPDGALGKMPDALGANAIMFDCPCARGERLIINLANPIGAPRVAGNAWAATGKTVDDLSLSPSVNSGCWHGWITNGEARSC